MKLHAPDLSRNNGPQNGKDGFHTVPNQALFAARPNCSRRGNEADNGQPTPKESASSRRRLRGDAPPGLHSRTQWNASLPALLVMFLLMTLVAEARTIYVSTNGRDSNPGSQTNPYRTVTKAHQAAANGDVIRLEGGHYEEYPAMTKRVTIENWNGVASVGSVKLVNKAPVIIGITNTTFYYSEGHWPGAAYVELPKIQDWS